MANAKPGDLLMVEILDIRTVSQGVVTTLPGCGPLSDTQQIRTKPITIQDNHALFNDIRFPINPMIGVIGVAPASEAISTKELFSIYQCRSKGHYLRSVTYTQLWEMAKFVGQGWRLPEKWMSV